jgi:hypothetical protein
VVAMYTTCFYVHDTSRVYLWVSFSSQNKVQTFSERSFKYICNNDVVCILGGKNRVLKYNLDEFVI